MKIPNLLNIRKSIQSKIFFSFILVILLPSITIGISSYIISLNILKEKVSSSFKQTVLYVQSSIERELEQVRQVSDYIFVNEDIKNAILVKKDTPYEQVKSIEKAEQTFKNYSIANIFRNISIVKIYGLEGSNLSFAVYETTRNLLDDKIRKSEWFESTLDNDGQLLWAGTGENFFKNQDTTEKMNDISLFRVIKNRDYNSNIGVMYISLQPKVFSQPIDELNLNGGSEILILDNHNNILNKPVSGLDPNFADMVLKAGMKGEKDNLIITDKKAMVFYCQIEDFDWKIIGILPFSELSKDYGVIFYITAIAFLVSFIFSGIIWYFISSGIVKPIKKLTKKMKSVREGNLDVKVDSTSMDEIGELSSNFNYMIDRINQLFNEVVQKQISMKDAEYKALQAQINPHFLYNTLNSIRWMAIIHKADNIKRMVDALGRLLKNSTSKIDKLITIKEEIDNLKDYVYIQQLAYKNKFEVDWDLEEDIFDCKCLKFILQPLVENAIFHGIEPKGSYGTIFVSVKKIDDLIEFVVRDDGVGITEEQIRLLLLDSSEKRRGFSGIGVNSINERIKMTYGNRYGLKIESELGSYTKITLQIPAVRE